MSTKDLFKKGNKALTKSQEEKILLIVTEKIDEAVINNENFSDFSLIEKFSGFNYSRGENVIFKVYKN